MEECNESVKSYFLGTPELDAPSANRIVALGSWLRDTEPLNVRAEMTTAGAAIFRVGRATRRNKYDFYNYAIAIASLAHVAAQNHWIPAPMEATALASNTVAATFCLGAFGALCAAKSLKIAIQDRSTYLDASARGTGRIGAAKLYAEHLGLEIQARVPNFHAGAAIGAGLLALCAEKIGLKRAALALGSFGQASEPRSKAFKAWRAGAVRKACFMLNDELRSADCYREALRLTVAHSLGHFELIQPKPQDRLSDAEKKIFGQLAAGFDRAFPTRTASYPTSDVRPEGARLLSFFGCAQRTMESASASGAKPLYAPAPGMPNLSEVLGMLAWKASQYPGFDSERDYLEGGAKNQDGEPDSLARQWAPWRALLEAQSIGHGLEQNSLSIPTRRPSRI